MPDASSLPKLTPTEAKVIAEIKNLTRKSAYGNISVTIKAGMITAIQVTKDIRTKVDDHTS